MRNPKPEIGNKFEFRSFGVSSACRLILKSVVPRVVPFRAAGTVPALRKGSPLRRLVPRLPRLPPQYSGPLKFFSVKKRFRGLTKASPAFKFGRVFRGRLIGKMKKLIDKAAVLIEALPYIQKFRGSIVVVKFGGSAMENLDLVQSAMRDIVFMECVGMRPVVVHGGGKDISARLRECKIESRFVNGLRVSCSETIEVVDDVLHNVVNKRLADAVEGHGGRALRISGKDILSGKLKDPQVCRETGELTDLGAVGDIESVDTGPILDALESEEIPIIAPLAMDGASLSPLNVNADIAACDIARALNARKLVFLSDVPGILRDAKDEDSLISTVTMDEVDELIEHGVIAGGMTPKIKSAEEALRSGVNKVHIVDGRLKHALMLEIFTDSGVGTQMVR